MLIQLRSAIEAMDLKLTRYGDGEWVTAYIVPAGPWHRILGLVRDGSNIEAQHQAEQIAEDKP